MFQLLRRVIVGWRRSAAGRRPVAAAGRGRPGVEGLEDRQLLSVTPLLSMASVAQVPVNQAPVQVPQPPPDLSTGLSTASAGSVQIADLTGVRFALKSLTNGTNHQLAIQTQTDLPDGTATFTGLWDAGNGPGAAVTGTLRYDSANNIYITFTWGNHSFEGTITGTPGYYHLDGYVTVPGGGGPGHVAGDQVRWHFPPVDYVNLSTATFAM